MRPHTLMTEMRREDLILVYAAAAGEEFCHCVSFPEVLHEDITLVTL